MDSTRTQSQPAQGSQGQGGQMAGQDGFPVDNNTYNLMQALVSKLEAIEVYRKYMKDGEHQIFQEMMQQDRQQAQRLVAELKQALQKY